MANTRQFLFLGVQNTMLQVFYTNLANLASPLKNPRDYSVMTVLRILSTGPPPSVQGSLEGL